MNYEDMLIEFMQKHDQYTQRTPGHIPFEVTVLRMRLMAEELGETFAAMHAGNVVEVADGLADLVYVAIGTAVAHGIPFDKVFREVHRSNMTKAKLNRDNKGGKAAGYEPPHIAEVLGIPTL